MNCYSNTKNRIRNNSREYAFTVTELLIALAISAMLLAAIAVAFHASVVNYDTNNDLFNSLNSARLALLRITTQLRTSDAVNPDSPGNECELITSAAQTIKYRYNAADNTLYLDKAGSSYALCENVTAMNFTKTTDTVDSVTFVKSVQITITVQTDSTEKTLSAATAIRKNLD